VSRLREEALTLHVLSSTAFDHALFNRRIVLTLGATLLLFLAALAGHAMSGANTQHHLYNLWILLSGIPAGALAVLMSDHGDLSRQDFAPVNNELKSDPERAEAIREVLWENGDENMLGVILYRRSNDDDFGVALLKGHAESALKPPHGSDDQLLQKIRHKSTWIKDSIPSFAIRGKEEKYKTLESQIGEVFVANGKRGKRYIRDWAVVLVKTGSETRDEKQITDFLMQRIFSFMGINFETRSRRERRKNAWRHGGRYLPLALVALGLGTLLALNAFAQNGTVYNANTDTGSWATDLVYIERLAVVTGAVIGDMHLLKKVLLGWSSGDLTINGSRILTSRPIHVAWWGWGLALGGLLATVIAWIFVRGMDRTLEAFGIVMGEPHKPKPAAGPPTTENLVAFLTQLWKLPESGVEELRIALNHPGPDQYFWNPLYGKKRTYSRFPLPVRTSLPVLLLRQWLEVLAKTEIDTSEFKVHALRARLAAWESIQQKAKVSQRSINGPPDAQNRAA
jgi:hypothetical protein